MQLKITTDYAIRSILCLARKDRLTTSAEIAQEMAIPPKYVLSVMGTLKRAGMVRSYNGPNGGFRLALPPDQITLLDILKLSEDTIKCNRCLESDGFCSMPSSESCPLRSVYLAFQRFVEEKFFEITIARLMDSTDDLQHFLDQECIPFEKLKTTPPEDETK